MNRAYKGSFVQNSNIIALRKSKKYLQFFFFKYVNRVSAFGFTVVIILCKQKESMYVLAVMCFFQRNKRNHTGRLIIEILFFCLEIFTFYLYK